MSVPLKYNLRNLVERKGTTLMTAFGIALTVSVLVTSLALTEGLVRVFGSSGHPLQFLVLRDGVDAELSSTVTEDAYMVVRSLPGIASGEGGKELVSQEAVTVVNLPSVDSPAGMNVSVRGLSPVGISLRPVEIASGRMLTPGRREVVVGEGIARRYPSARVGERLRFGRGLWEVVGTFRAGESAANSEIWADLNQLRGDFERAGGSSSLLVRANSASEMAALRKTIDDDQRLSVDTLSEKEYYARQTRSGALLMGLGYSVAVIMAVGSAFAATNTMYAAVARRTREIGTLRALGFSRASILFSFVFESVALATLGGVLGVLIALPVNGLTTGVGNFSTFSEVAFQFRITPQSALLAIAFSATIGLLGGFLPAFSAARKDPIAAMREP